MERKLATIRRVLEVKPIEGADRIELCGIDGWQSVIRKGEFNVGDLVIFAEIDSIIPFAPWSEFLRDPKNPERRIRLKTKKLKKVISQGVVFPLNILPIEKEQFCGNMEVIVKSDGTKIPVEDGIDVTEILGIEKYNPEIPACWAGKIKGNFPTHMVPKTDSGRLQNLWKDSFKDEIHGKMFAVTHKMDGTSLTCYSINGEIGVCSRDFVLDLNDEGNVYVEMFKKYDLANFFTKLGLNIAIQAEIIGEGIQKNMAHIKGKEIRVFDIYDIDAQRYYSYDQLHAFCRVNNLPQVHTLTDIFVFDKNIHDLDYFIRMTEQKYVGTNQQIEGLIFAPIQECYSNELVGRLRFKVINPNYLLENE